MRFAAATLLAGMVFLAAALSGFGKAPPGPQDFPQAIRLSGVSAPHASSPGAAVALPELQAGPAQVGGSAPVAVVHNVVSVPLTMAAAPHVDPAPSGSAPGATGATEQLPVPVLEIVPAPPAVDTTVSPVAGQSPTPSPTQSPTPSGTSTLTPSPSPLLPLPTPTGTGILHNVLGRR